MPRKLNTRATAAQLSWQIIDQGQSLDAALARYFENTDISLQDRGFAQELVYGVCRWYGLLDNTAASLLRSPIRKKDRVVHFILLVGLYQLMKLDTAEHAAVAETVSACKQLNKAWAKNVINGCLRNHQRSTAAQVDDEDRLSHPQWILHALENAWPQQYEQILNGNNQRPPMCLRVNRMQNSREDYLSELGDNGIAALADQYSSDGIILERAMTVSALPRFDSGACSVQDTAAQLSADLLSAEPGMTVLDACAAPGGKTAHILERAKNKLILDALDVSEHRCEQLHSTLARLQLTANVVTADAANEPSWQIPAGGYDRILIDAPCSGLGVIRRHPDIKHHRRQSDINALQVLQAKLLTNLWNLLKPNGRLLYMTCSVLPTENESQIQQFVANQNDAMLIGTPHPHALSLEHGVQTLPGVHGMDGFYYCLLEKSG